MDINSLRINEGFNEAYGLFFKIELRGSHYIVDLLIRETQGRVKRPIQIRMEPDNHPPHIHLRKGKNYHFATFSLEGILRAGGRGLSPAETNAVRGWLSQHGKTLLELWNCLKNGDNTANDLIKRINETWEYQGHIYNGVKPEKEAHYPDLIVWYNGCLSEKRLTASMKEVHSTGSMCVYYNKKCELNSDLIFKSDIDLQIN